MKRNWITLICLCLFIVCGCDKSSAPDPGVATVTLVFELELNEDVYLDSIWGESPQFAIWLENPETGQIRTVFVTYRTGCGDWEGKVECPVSLPYWASRYMKEAGTTSEPTFRNPVASAITGATPELDFRIDATVASGGRWDYYIEVNVSGDFNATFPSMRPDGSPDDQGNGQPSLIYHGQIAALDGNHGNPMLIGRTAQYSTVSRIIPDLAGVTTSKKLLSSVTVSCKQ